MKALLSTFVAIYIPLAGAVTPVPRAPDLYQEPAPIVQKQPSKNVQQQAQTPPRRAHQPRVIGRQDPTVVQPRVIRRLHPNAQPPRVIARRPHQPARPPYYADSRREYRSAPPHYYDGPRVYRRVYRQGPPPPYGYYAPRAAYPILPPRVILQFGF